jgi:hypothetical protein
MAEPFDRLVAEQPPAIADLARATRAVLLGLLPGADETVDGGDAGYGYGRGYAGLVFVLTPTQRGVRLGLYDGATLDDPAGLLRGRGTRHRHLVLAAPDDLERPELRDLLARAAARRRAQLQPAD